MVVRSRDGDQCDSCPVLWCSKLSQSKKCSEKSCLPFWDWFCKLRTTLIRLFGINRQNRWDRILYGLGCTSLPSIQATKPQKHVRINCVDYETFIPFGIKRIDQESTPDDWLHEDKLSWLMWPSSYPIKAQVYIFFGMFANGNGLIKW